MSFKEYIENFEVLVKNLAKNEDLKLKINNAVNLLCDTIKAKNPILIFGNGGSASDALHISGELVGRFLKERDPINIICLNSNVAVITAWANDYSYETIFERQVKAHSKKGGVCWGISTSGSSSNVLKAFIKAKELEMKTISLTGKNGGQLKDISDININVPSDFTPRNQSFAAAVKIVRPIAKPFTRG